MYHPGVNASVAGSRPQTSPPPEYETPFQLRLRSSDHNQPSSAATLNHPGHHQSPSNQMGSTERLLSLWSRSHPDLSKLDEELAMRRADSYLNPVLNQSAVHYANLPCTESLPPTPQKAMPASSLVEALRNENHALKTELDMYRRRVDKLQKFELGVQQVHLSHEELIRSSEKTEKLERAVRYKLEIELRRLQAQNRELEQHNAALQAIAHKTKATNGQDDNEIQKRDLLIAQLLSQNKELQGEKETQEYELNAQRLTLEEQRNHIEILDSALMSAQNNVVTLESELRKKACFEERATHLQKALQNLQLASDRRLQMEKRARNHLEKEIDNLKKHLNHNNSNHNPNHNTINGANLKKSIQQNCSFVSAANHGDYDELKKVTREYEEKIISLETEVTKWEQKFIEESALRHIEVSAASAPKEAKIAALEKTSQESQRMIVEARQERLKHMDDLHASNKRALELESKMKDLESRLAQKDAMIKVLEQHSRDKDADLQRHVFQTMTDKSRPVVTSFSQPSTMSRSHARSASVSTTGLRMQRLPPPISHVVSSSIAESSLSMGHRQLADRDGHGLQQLNKPVTTLGRPPIGGHRPPIALKRDFSTYSTTLNHNHQNQPQVTNNQNITVVGVTSNNNGGSLVERSTSSASSTSSPSSGFIPDSGSASSNSNSNNSINTNTQSKTSLDEQLKELDLKLSSKDSIIRALRSEKERYPNHFWRL